MGQWYKHSKISRKIGLAVGILLAAIVVLGTMSLLQVHAVQRGLETVYRDRVIPMKSLKIISDRYAVNVVDASQKAQSGEMSMAQAAEEITRAQAEIESEWRTFQGKEHRREEESLVREFEALKLPADQLTNRLVKALRSNNRKGLDKLVSKEMYPVIDPVTDRISRLIELQQQVAETEYRGGQRVFLGALWSVGVLGSLSVLFALGVTVLLRKSILGPVQEINQTLVKFREGDLNTTVSYESRDELGQLADQFRFLMGRLGATTQWASRLSQGDLRSATNNTEDENDVLGRAMRSTTESLGALIQSVHETSERLRDTSGRLRSVTDTSSQAVSEIAGNTDEVNRAVQETARTTTEISAASEQLAMLAETAARTMESLNEAVRGVREGANRQAGTVQAVTEVVAQGSKSVERTMAAMEEIGRKVQQTGGVIDQLGEKQAQIGAIVGTIDDIAQQTNLLALNAAIEAARAGAQGRGFAVVADEVRKLAERASHSTKAIDELIGSIRHSISEALEAMERTDQEVREGAGRTEEAKAAFSAILLSTEDLRVISEQNSNLVDSMARQTDDMTRVITSVASVSEETAAAAEEMSAGSEEVSASMEEVAASIELQVEASRELSLAAHDLGNVADHLGDLVNQFQVETASTQPQLRLSRAA